MININRVLLLLMGGDIFVTVVFVVVDRRGALLIVVESKLSAIVNVFVAFYSVIVAILIGNIR